MLEAAFKQSALNRNGKGQEVREDVAINCINLLWVILATSSAPNLPPAPHRPEFGVGKSGHKPDTPPTPCSAVTSGMGNYSSIMLQGCFCDSALMRPQHLNKIIEDTASGYSNFFTFVEEIEIVG